MGPEEGGGGSEGGGDGDSNPSSTGRSNPNIEETLSLIFDKYSAACALSNGGSEGALLSYKATVSSVYTSRNGWGVLGVLAIWSKKTYEYNVDKKQ